MMSRSWEVLLPGAQHMSRTCMEGRMGGGRVGEASRQALADKSHLLLVQEQAMFLFEGGRPSATKRIAVNFLF